MDVYIKLPGHATSLLRPGYEHWLPVQGLHFERPLLEKDPARFTVYKMPDALSAVLAGLAARGDTLRRVEVHRVEGHQALGRLHFDQVRISSLRIDGESDLAMERVSFSARRWQDG
ncbi:MAG: hypothetical protein RJA10_4313 [Pseudomonadota bacterium]|jgi:hypothetical protein